MPEPTSHDDATSLDASDVTLLLNTLERSDPSGANQLLELVYDELRRVAGKKMAQERPGNTLQPTALVHEAFLRLTAGDQQVWENRRHFFSAAAEAMRRILIDRARRKAREKHGGHLERVELENIDLAIEASDDQLLALDEALQKLAQAEPQGAELIRLRFYVGLPNKEAAKLLNVSERTGKRLWAYCRAWLLDHLSQSN